MPMASEVERMIPCSRGYLFFPASAWSSFAENSCPRDSLSFFSPEQLPKNRATNKKNTSFFMIIPFFSLLLSHLLIYEFSVICFSNKSDRRRIR